MSAISKINKNNSMLLDIQYVKPNREKKLPDCLYFIYRDLDTNEKKLVTLENPKMTIYFEKPELRNHVYNKNYIRKDDTIPVTVDYSKIMYSIAEEAGPSMQQMITDCFNTRRYKDLQNVQLYPYVFGSDYDIRVWYRYHWKKSFNNDIPKHLKKGFLDIEVDSYESVGLPTPESNPIDLVTVIDVDAKRSYTFLLTGVNYIPKFDLNSAGSSLISEEDRKHEEERKALYEKRTAQHRYWSTHIDELKQKAHEAFDENYPGMEYNFYFYTDELKMITHIFQLINMIKMDFIGIWNIDFDIPYFINRIKVLGGDPTEIMCHPDFINKECWYKRDTNHFEIKNKTDFFHISSYTVFICQMRNYAAIRKGGSELRNNRLNSIAQKELKDSKYDYSDSGNIKTVSYNNYLNYVLYNIKDVLLQVGIEEKTHDMDTYYIQSYENLTPYEDNFKQTKALRNVIYESFMQQGLVPGNNINQILNAQGGKNKGEDGKYYDEEGEAFEDNEEKKDEVGYEGALVGDPMLNEYFGVSIYGKPSRNVFDFGIDLDMSAFYPNTVMADNIDPSCLIGKVIIKADKFAPRGGKYKYNGITDSQMVKRNKDSFSDDIGKEICDNLKTNHFITFGNKWLNLPSVTDMCKLIEKEYDYING